MWVHASTGATSSVVYSIGGAARARNVTQPSRFKASAQCCPRLAIHRAAASCCCCVGLIHDANVQPATPNTGSDWGFNFNSWVEIPTEIPITCRFLLRGCLERQAARCCSCKSGGSLPWLLNFWLVPISYGSSRESEAESSGSRRWTLRCSENKMQPNNAELRRVSRPGFIRAHSTLSRICPSLSHSIRFNLPTFHSCYL